MDPKTFMRSIEEQLRRVKSQYFEMKTSSGNSSPGSEELLNNAKLWFLRTLQNTELRYDDLRLPAADYVAVESFTLQRIPPYGLVYPCTLWLLSTLPKEQVESIFGPIFYEKLVNIARSFPPTENKGNYSNSRGS